MGQGKGSQGLGTYQDVHQEQLGWVSALLVEHLLHAGLRGVGLEPAAVSVQAVVNLWEIFWGPQLGQTAGMGRSQGSSHGAFPAQRKIKCF